MSISAREDRVAPPQRLLLVSADALGRTGLASLLGEESIAAALEPNEVASWLENAGLPDLVVWDLGWGATEVPQELRDLEAANIPILVMVDDANQAAEVRQSIAASVLSRASRREVLASAMIAAAAGLIVIDPAFDARPIPGHPEAEPTLEPLTPREVEVLQWVAEGLPNKAIALRLGIRETTVKFHVNSILAKLGAQSRTEAVTRAARLGLILL
jgi:two-component system, NarL family, nitrate/nitrite response regulator NarL